MERAIRSFAHTGRSWPALLAAAVLLNSCGGGDSSSDPSRGPIVGAPQDATFCASADLSRLTSVVYVSSLGADADGCGTRSTNACATIDKGITACAASGCGVLVRHGLYETSATLHLRDGVDVHGSCRFDGEPDHRYRSTILAAPAAGTPAVQADSINNATVFSGFVVIRQDESANGTASIAMVVKASLRLTLTDTVLVAGVGGPGATGATQPAAAGDGGSNASGQAGAAGGVACPSQSGGAQAGRGGNGGDGLMGDTNICFPTCACFSTNEDSSLGQAGSKSGSIFGGGGGQKAFGGEFCTGPAFGNDFNGKNGGQGQIGTCATAGGTTSHELWGTLDGSAWRPGSGGAGSTGSVGSGGGGGSSGGYCVGFPDGIHAQFVQGVSAGGGGGGGCGGSGGGGGEQGGASIGLMLVDSSAALGDSNAIVPGQGGAGGPGGGAGTGGVGGTAGSGQRAQVVYVGASLCPGPSGNGGPGGQGGPGSGGAGGNGGPSIGIAYAGTTPPPSSTDGIYAPIPGGPGIEGSGSAGGKGFGGCTPPDGAAGSVGTGALAFQLDATLNPASSVLGAGERLAIDQKKTSPDGTVEFIMQGDGNLCLYKSGAYQWCSHQDGPGDGASVTMETTGNLCLQPSGQCVLQSGPPPRPWSYVQVRNDGHVVITDGAAVYWKVP